MEIRVSGSLSSHNSEQDEVDRRLWEEMRKKIKEIADEPQYDHLIVEVF
jgi:hypothetical protein